MALKEIPCRSNSRSHRRRLDRQSPRARHQIKLELDQFRRAVVVSLGADAGDAVAQAALQRTQRLPLQPVERIAGRLSLGDCRAGEVLVPIVVVAIGAAEIELALSLHEQLSAFGNGGFELRVGVAGDGDTARLPRHECGEREQVVALVRQRSRLLMRRAAQIDALLQIDWTASLLVEGGIAGRHALHAGARVFMAIRAGLARRTSLAVPKRFAVEHPQHAGIGGIVVLHRSRVRRHEAEPRSALSLRDFSGENSTEGDGRRGQQRSNRYLTGRPHSTDIEAEAVSLKPLSPIHSKSNLPLSVATVKKVMNGFAAIAGNRSARKISTPL